MMPIQSQGGELAALRRLKQAVRACGLPAMMVSGQVQLEMLAMALKEVAEARTQTEAAGTEAAF